VITRACEFQASRVRVTMRQRGQPQPLSVDQPMIGDLVFRDHSIDLEVFIKSGM
jgi:hypothetical protein